MTDTDSGEEISRDELYELVWSKPMMEVASRFGVSSSYMARVCRHLNVPRPPRGYWAKVSAGKSVGKIPPLPTSQPGHHQSWSRGALGFRSPELDPTGVDETNAAPPPNRLRSSSRHPLLDGARELFLIGRKSRSLGYLKPSKVILPDITATEAGLDTALSVANKLFLEMERRGHRVSIAPDARTFERVGTDLRETAHPHPLYENLWVPRRCTVVYVGTLAIGLSILEMTEAAEAKYVNGTFIRLDALRENPTHIKQFSRHSEWVTTIDYPTGRICIHAYCPYQTANWSRHWREEKSASLLGRIPAIVQEIEDSSAEIARLVAEGNRRQEEESRQFDENWARWEREAANKRAAEAAECSRNALLGIIGAWDEARRVQVFFAEVERQLSTLSPESRETIAKQLERARELVGSTDALALFSTWAPLGAS
ncbi:hypothetical protein [Pandoraea commovens]|uniref:Uncharacterized protein n=1 Tax=Pandoraea commovens TaxID=2508289 RepID=A0ABY5QG52_9BURK|nr:hypothetical protein [Pandoraea commovens]UVA79402.1 hypothetical protein NTU39_26035 [Pandoraea commovens]